MMHLQCLDNRCFSCLLKAAAQCWDSRFSKKVQGDCVEEHSSREAVGRYGRSLTLSRDMLVPEKAHLSYGMRLRKHADGHCWPRRKDAPDSRALIRAIGVGFEDPAEKVISGLAVPDEDGRADVSDLGYLCRKAPLVEVLNALFIMDQQGLSVSPHIYPQIMQRCKRLVEAKVIQLLITRRGLMIDDYLGSRLVDMFVRCGSLADAKKVFSKLHQPNESAWNVLILAYIKENKFREAVRMYQNMQAEGFRPSRSSINGLLKACSRKVDLKLGKQLHADAVKYGYESDIFVSTTLLNMYLKCNSISEALHIFNKLSLRDVAAWTAMIQGYVQQGKADLALKLYYQMQDEGVVPDGRTFVAILKACGSLGDLVDRAPFGQDAITAGLAKGMFIHSQIKRLGLESNIYVGNALVDMYAKCGSMVNALQVFNNLPKRDVVTWTTLISAYAQKDQAEQALRFYKQMHQERVVPDGKTFVAILNACGNFAAIEDGKMMSVTSLKQRRLEIGKSIHSQIVSMGFCNDIFVQNSLVDMYAKCGSMEDAQQVFDNMRHHDVITWNALILGYVENGKTDIALRLFDEMQATGIIPDAWNFVAVLKACGSLAAVEDGKLIGEKLVKPRSLEKVKHMHSLVKERELNSHPLVSTALVDAYELCGSMEDAQQVIDDLSWPNVAAWTALISGYAQLGDGNSAFKVYMEMKSKGLVPNDRTFIALLKACCSLAAVEDEKVIFGKSLKLASLEKGRLIHSEIVKTGLEMNKFLGTSLIDMFVKCGSMLDAQQVFDKLQARDVVMWTAIISGYAYQGECQLAMEMYNQMQKEGVVPDEQTFCNMLKGCGKAGSLRLGKELHADSIRKGLWSNTLAAHVIEMYGRCGNMAESQVIFEQFPEQGIELWNALIGGYARNGESEVALHYFERLQRSGIKLNDISYKHVLSACSHAGLVDKGLKYFAMLRKENDISPTIEHFSCKIDLLGRAGRLNEAEDVLVTMPMPPTLVIWTTLLGACQKFGNVEIGRRTFDAARRHNPMTASIYVLMSNIYAKAHMWKKVEEIQKMRNSGHVWKTPGLSWIEVDGKVHVFLVNDKAHPKTEEIYAELKRLNSQMEEEGYVPHLDSVLHRKDNESKALALCGHSEKLAIAFGLISTSAPEPILVMKNLRSCLDCHSATAFISKVTGRAISVRDSNRFHHFKDGMCSCGGFW